MIGRAGVVGAAVLLALSTVFAALNRGSSVGVDLGLFELRRVPMPIVVFGAVLIGMAIMLLAGLRSDLRVREILRSKWEEEGRREQEWRDRNQQELFGAEERETDA